MAGLVDGTINGYLDIRGAILRVGQLDIVGISGVDMATNVLKQDSVLMWDDQGTDLANPPFTLRGGASRDTSNGYIVLTGASGGRITRGIKLPNAWMMDFDLYASTSGGSVKVHAYTTQESTYDGTSGYELEFAPSAGTVTIRYRGTQVHQATSVTAYATNQFQHYVVGFERGAWTVSIDGVVVVVFDDDERADVYDNTSGQYFRIDASAQQAYEIRMRKFRLASNGFWLKERNGNLSYETGNVSIGGRNSTHRFDVRGSANVGALTSTTFATSATDVEATDTATGTVTTHSLGVVSNAHVQNVYASNCIVDASLNVFSTANVGALTATSVDASDATAATGVSTGAIVVSGTDGGLGVASNIHATNVFAASHVGVATSDTAYNLDVRGTANVGVLSATLPLATVASNLVTYDTASGQLLDSNGLVSNKLAIVSEQPPSALTAATTTVSGHGKYVVASSTGTAYNAFDKSSTAWTSGETYDASTGAYDGAVDLGGAETVSGEYVTITFPYKTTLRHVTLLPGGTTASFPGTAYIYGSNDSGTTWTALKNWSGVTPSSTSDVQTFTVNASASYKQYALVVNATSAGSTTAQVGELRLFTETFSVDAGVVSTTAASGLDVGYTEHPVEPMTGYHTYVEGHGTYEASASSEQSGTAWKMFNQVYTGSIADDGIVWSDLYSADGTYQGSKHTADVGGTRYTGEWVQLKTPYAIMLSHFKWFPVQNWEYRSPAKGLVLGSNDGENWYKLTSWSGQTFTFSSGSEVTVNAATAYQYFRLVVENTGTSSDFTQWRASAMEWRLFAEKPVTRMENVHISGDLSSETLQTGYIKWPRVPLKANESEGYVASASSTGSISYRAFNHTITSATDNWVSQSAYTNGVANSSADTFEGVSGEWIKIKLPRAIQLSHFNFYNQIGGYRDRAPRKGRIWASNDDLSWTQIGSFSGLQDWVNYVPKRVDVHASSTYAYYVFQAETILAEIGNSQYTNFSVGEIELFEAATGVGAAPTSAKLQVHGSLGMAKGSDLYAGDDVVMELPKHDRPLTKYPEVLASATNVTTTGLVQTWAGYTSNVSSSGVNDGGRLAYDGLFDTVNPWISASGTYETTGGTATSSDSFESTSGSFLKLALPNKIRLSHVCIYNRDSASTKAPKNGIIWGSDDGGTTFSQIRTFSNLDPTRAMKHTLHITSTNKYDTIVVQITAIQVPSSGTYDQVAIQELELYGYEEGDTSVDVVHRSVPNTPGTQQLAVYWDANDSNSYSFADSSNVYDLSGNGVTGTITGTNGFDAEYNAWVFDGSSYISGTLTHTTGAWAHTVSTWVYRDVTSSTTNQHIFHFGGTSTNTACSLRFQLVSERWLLRYYFFANDVLFYPKNVGETFGNWIHIVATYDGGSDSGVSDNGFGLARKIYINGEECLVQTSSTPGSLALATTSSTFYAGNRQGSALQHDLIGKMANVRVYSKALSSDQVKELFDYEAARFGHREDVVTLKNGNLGIGLRDPEQRLVVAGSLQEFPPGPMTNYYTHFTGHGVFSVDAGYGPSEGYPASHGFHAWKVFNDAIGSDDKYHGGNDYGGTDYAYNAGTHSLGGIAGDYIILNMPYKVKAKAVKLAYGNRAAEDFTILGSNDGSSWSVIKSFVNENHTTVTTFDLSSNEYYNRLAIVVTRLKADTYWNCRTLSYYGVPQMDVTDGRQLNVGQVMTSSVGIGTSAPHFPLTVSGSTDLTGTTAAFKYFNVGASNGDHYKLKYLTGETSVGNVSIFAGGSIISNDVVGGYYGTVSGSDKRIKKEIVDIEDASALDTFRLLQPKQYAYRDEARRGHSRVWGFIAQEVADTLQYSIRKHVVVVPNVYELANVYADGMVLEFDTTKLETSASKLRLYDRNDREEDVLIDEIVDEYTVRLAKSIGNADQVFVYGQEVNDFHFLKKDAIWTTAAAALQEVDRQLQAEKAKTKTLESKLAGERVPLENAEGLAIDANYAPCVTANDPLFYGIVDADGYVAATNKGKRAKVWVTNIGAPLSAGDIIATTSNVAGYCSKLTDLAEVHRAVGKVLVDVALPQVTDHNFVAPTVPRKRKVTVTSNATVWVREFKSTAEQYATLGEDERRVRDEVYYARDDVVEVVRNPYVDKMPAHDFESYHRTQIDTCDADVYEGLPESEKVNYVLGEDGVYAYTHRLMLSVEEWSALEDVEERNSYVHGYFKNTTEELSETEWTALEDSAVRARYERRTRPEYFRLIVAREARAGYAEEVRSETVDVLDAYGRPTYEDVEGETDPAFEFRYLTTEGVITDRHSGVHMAALVECLLF